MMASYVLINSKNGISEKGKSITLKVAFGAVLKNE